MVFVNGFLSIAKEFSKGGSSAERREMIASHWKANTKDITFLKKNFSDLHIALAEDIKTIINQEEK